MPEPKFERDPLRCNSDDVEDVGLTVCIDLLALVLDAEAEAPAGLSRAKIVPAASDTAASDDSCEWAVSAWRERLALSALCGDDAACDES